MHEIYPSNWVTILRKRALHQPHRLAYTFLPDGDSVSATLTFQELDRKARAIAAQLQRLSAAKQRALLLYPPGLSYVVAFYGCLYADVIAVPLYPPHRRKVPLIESIAADCEAKIVLTTMQVLSKAWTEFGSDTAVSQLRWLATDDFGDDTESWNEPSIDVATIAYLQYTSGSTSTPKGVIIDHGMAIHQCAELALSWGVWSDSIMVSWLPHFHDFGQVAGVLMPIYCGSQSVLMSSASFIQQPIRWLNAISKYKATHSAAPNFAYDHCVDKITPEQCEGLNLGSLAMMSNGAEPVRKSTLDRFYTTFKPYGFRWEMFCPGYGLAEATLKVTSNQWDVPLVSRVFEGESLQKNRVCETAHPDERSLVGCGGTVLNTKVVIVDPKSLRPVASNEVGEIWVSGPAVSNGYWNRPEETKRTFQAYMADTNDGPFLRTGDLGFIKDGELYISGRLKDLIIVRGSNHYPQDIEFTVEQSHPILRPGFCAVFSVELQGAERLVIVAERKRFDPHTFDSEEVIQAIRQSVSQDHGLDTHAILLLKTGSIPKTTSGKIQRQECKRRFFANQLDVIAYWLATRAEMPLQALKTTPETTANTLQALIRYRIREQMVSWVAHSAKECPAAIDLKCPISAYGVDSINMMEIHSKLERYLRLEIPPEWLWESPSIGALIQQVSENPIVVRHIAETHTVVGINDGEIST